jgi:hypothetical protein
MPQSLTRSCPSSDLPATQRSRADESSAADAPDRNESPTSNDSHPAALDATAPAPLPGTEAVA